MLGEQCAALCEDISGKAAVCCRVEYIPSEAGAGNGDGAKSCFERRFMRNAVNAECKAGDDDDRIAGKPCDKRLACIFAVGGMTP